MFVIGFDPGGKNAFGAAALIDRPDASQVAVLGQLSSVDEAIGWVRTIAASYGIAPTAAGIDTLLFWETGRSGDRAPDRWLRAAYCRANGSRLQNHPPLKNSVQTPNSLQGAMVIGGMALAIRLRAEWTGIQLNETHPRLLYFSLFRCRYDKEPADVDWSRLAASIGHVADADRTPHTFDALLSTLVTWRAIREPAQFDDLAWKCPDGTKPNGPISPAGEVTYWWPRQTTFLELKA